MKSKTSCFNKGLFKNNLRRFWPLWALYTVAGLLLIPMILMEENAYDPYARARGAIDTFSTLSGPIGILIAFAAAIIIAASMFGFLYGSKTSGLISSLPVKRECVFLTDYLSGLIPFVLTNCLIAGLCILACLDCDYMTEFAIQAILTWLAVYDMAFIAFYGLAVFCAFITGHTASLVLLYIIFSTLTVGVESLIRLVSSVLIDGLSNMLVTIEELLTEPLSPVFCLGDNCCFEEFFGANGDLTELVFEGWTAAGVWAGVGILLAVAALLLYRRRKMENTYDVVAVPAFRPIFKYGVSVCCALAIGILLYGMFFDFDRLPDAFEGAIESGFFVLFMLIGAFIGYFGSEMLLKKSLHVFRGRWTGYVILAALCAVFVVGCRFDVLNVSGYIPDRDKVESVWLDGTKLTEDQNIDGFIGLHNLLANSTDKRALFDENDEYCGYWIHLTYILNSGRSVSREYQLYYDTNSDIYKLCDGLLNSSEGIHFRCLGGMTIESDDILTAYMSAYDESTGNWEDINFTDLEASSLYQNGILKDMDEGFYGRVDPSTGSDFYVFDYLTLIVRGMEGPEYAGNVVDSTTGIDIPINDRMVNTIQWLAENKGVSFAQGSAILMN